MNGPAPDPSTCATCADEAVFARVVAVDGAEALVAPLHLRDGDGRAEGQRTGSRSAGAPAERVAVDLVPDAEVGDVLLCHAGIALEVIREAV